ncbi:MAG: hypothetical protein Q9170_007751 [Blastenia crenularia]
MEVDDYIRDEESSGEGNDPPYGGVRLSQREGNPEENNEVRSNVKGNKPEDKGGPDVTVPQTYHDLGKPEDEDEEEELQEGSTGEVQWVWKSESSRSNRGSVEGKSHEPTEDLLPSGSPQRGESEDIPGSLSNEWGEFIGTPHLPIQPWWESADSDELERNWYSADQVDLFMWAAERSLETKLAGGSLVQGSFRRDDGGNGELVFDFSDEGWRRHAWENLGTLNMSAKERVYSGVGIDYRAGGDEDRMISRDQGDYIRAIYEPWVRGREWWALENVDFKEETS